MPAFDQQTDPFADLVPQQPRRGPPPAPGQGGYGRVVTGGPRVATPQTPGAEASSYGSAAASGASADRTRALTPEELRALRLQNADRQRALDAGRSAEQDREQDRRNAVGEINAMTENLIESGRLYNENLRDVDPWIDLGIFPGEGARRFNRTAESLRQQAQGLFRVPNQGGQSDYDARLLERTYGINSQNYDADNEAIFDAIQRRLNARRQAYGLPPTDWRTGRTAPQPGEHITALNVDPGFDPNAPHVLDPGRREISTDQQAVVDEGRRTAAVRIQQMMLAGAPDEEILRVARETLGDVGNGNIPAILEERRRIGLPAFRRRAPGIDPSTYTSNRDLDPEERERARDAASPVGAFIANAADGLSGGAAGLFDPEYSRRMESIRARHPVASTIGGIAGSAAPAMGLERLASMGFTRAGVALGERDLMRNAPRLAGNVAYGGLAGASGNPDDRLAGLVIGGASGGVAGEVGAGFMRTAGSAVGGVRNAGARYLSDRRVPLTPGQIMRESEGPVAGFVGPMMARGEEALSSVSPTGARFRDSWRGAQNAAHDEALSTLPSATANRGARTGEELMQDTDAQISQAYRDVLHGVSLRSDRAFAQRAGAIMRNAQRPAIPAEQRQILTDTFQQLGELFQGGNLSGEGYQAARQIIQDARASIRSMPLSKPGLAVLRDTERNLGNLAARQQPGFAHRLGRVDAAYRRASILRDAQGRAVNAENGTISPGQLGTAARQGTRRYGGNAQAVSTRRPFYELQDAVRSVLPNRVADSGAAMRLAVPTAILGGGATADQLGLTDNSLRNAAIVAGLYTRPGQQALQTLLIRRPELMRQVGDFLAAPRSQTLGSHLSRGAFLPPFLDSTDR